jgi:hypothetical protein
MEAGISRQRQGQKETSRCSHELSAASTEVVKE